MSWLAGHYNQTYSTKWGECWRAFTTGAKAPQEICIEEKWLWKQFLGYFDEIETQSKIYRTFTPPNPEKLSINLYAFFLIRFTHMSWLAGQV